MKKLLISVLGLMVMVQAQAQTDSVAKAKPIGDVFEIVWTDTIRLKKRIGEPILNGKLVIPPYGNDGCYMAETGEKLYYTFSPHQEVIRENMASRYVLLKTEHFNVILDIETGEEVYEGFYREGKDQDRIPYLFHNRLVNSRYVCFANGPKTFACVDTNTMQEIWAFEAESVLYDYYVEDGQTVLVGSDKFIYAIDLKSGIEQWKLEVGKSITNMLLEDNQLYLCVEDKGIVAINIKTREILYKQDYVEDARKIALKSGLIYYIDNNLFAFDAQTGKMKFYSEGHSPCSNTDSYFVYKDHIFSQSCARNNYNLEGLDRHTGAKTHQAGQGIEDKPSWGFLRNAAYFSPVRGNMVYATSKAFIDDRFWAAVIYGVKIKDENL